MAGVRGPAGWVQARACLAQCSSFFPQGQAGVLRFSNHSTLLLGRWTVCPVCIHNDTEASLCASLCCRLFFTAFSMLARKSGSRSVAFIARLPITNCVAPGAGGAGCQTTLGRSGTSRAGVAKRRGHGEARPRPSTELCCPPLPLVLSSPRHPFTKPSHPFDFVPSPVAGGLAEHWHADGAGNVLALQGQRRVGLCRNAVQPHT